MERRMAWERIELGLKRDCREERSDGMADMAGAVLEWRMEEKGRGEGGE